MSIFNNPEENYWRNFATKTVLILITVAIIVWFLPRNEGRMFRYDVGKPWMYGSVIAKFDFPIYKTDEAIKREQDSLMKQFQPYYSVNESIGSEQVSRLQPRCTRFAKRICGTHSPPASAPLPDRHHRYHGI